MVTVRGVRYPSDLTDDQWDLLEPVFNAPSKRGHKHAENLRSVVDATLYIAQTGCQWLYLPESFGHGNEPAGAQSRSQPDHGTRANRAERGCLFYCS